MTTVTWNSGAVGDWNMASNWAPASVPGAGDTAVITAGSAELLSGIDPAANLVIDLGGPTIAGANGAVPNAYLETLNSTIGPGVTIADVTAGTEGVLATTGITAFTGVIDVFGANTAMVLGVDRPSGSPGVKFALPAGPITNAVPNPSDIGQFQNNGTIDVGGGAGFVVVPLNTADIGYTSMLIGTVNLDHGTLAAVGVTMGDPTGGFGTSGTINLAHNSTAEITQATNIDVNFQDGTGNRLILASTQQAAVITGFQAGDTIEQLPQSLFGSNTPYQNQGLSYNASSHVLQITTGVGGTPYLTYQIDGTYSQGDFQAADDASGNLLITLACFAAGTRIATDRGAVAVEALAVGDRVVTARAPGAPCRAVRWIGYRHVDLRRHPHPAAARPIRVRAGAFADGLPHRDLLLSPDHALFLDGVLIPVRYLVNGASIAPDEDIDAVTYFHVELATHDVLLAEGLPAESYLDTGNRRQFGNGGTLAALHADFSGRARTWERDACAPLRGDGPLVTAARERLLVRALDNGFLLTPGNEIWLEAGGIRVDPSGVAGDALRFMLPAAEGDICIRSRAGVPAEIDPLSDDRRRLGAMVERVVLRRGRKRCVLHPHDSWLAEGFHQPEGDGARRWRWTDGSGRIPAGLLPAGAERPIVEIRIGGLHPWWRAAPPTLLAARRGA